MNQSPKESDWKQFSRMTADLRERYLKEKNRELAGILTDPAKTPTEQFWCAFEKMSEERKILRDCLDHHSRSRMFMSMACMRRYGMIGEEDLKLFSTALQGELEGFCPSEDGSEAFLATDKEA